MSSITVGRLAPLNRGLATEAVDVDAAGTGALLWELWDARVLRGLTNVATTVANLGLGRGQTCSSEAEKNKCVKVELHLDKSWNNLGYREGVVGGSE